MAVYMVQQSAAPVGGTEERATQNNPAVNHCKEASHS